MTKVAYRRMAVDRIEIFYREARRSNAPKLLLLHGFQLQATCSAISFRCSPTDFM
jgi:hypothetical protein